MKSAYILKQKIDDGQTTLGVLLTSHLWFDVIDIAINANLDYLIVDTEHIDHGQEKVSDFFRICRLANLPALLRPPDSNLTTIRQAIDLGPCGLLLPSIETPQQLDTVRDGIYMPPRGLRRPGGPGNRWLKRFDYESFKSIVEDAFVVIPQIESEKGLSNAQAIAEHEIVTALGIGPFDLSAQLGVCFDPSHPKLQEAWEQLRRVAKQTGKAMWAIGDGQTLLEQGHHFICLGEPGGLLERMLSTTVAGLHKTIPN